MLAGIAKCSDAIESGFRSQEDDCGLPNVCNRYMLIGSREVSKTVTSTTRAQHRGLTMVDLSSLFRGPCRRIGARRR